MASLGIRTIASPARFGRRNFSDLTSVIHGCASSFVELHTATGLPWWALVPITTITLRSIVTLPFAILNRKRILKQHLLRPIVNAMYPILKFNLMRKQMSTMNNSVVMSNANPMAKLTYEQAVLMSAKEKRKRQRKLYKENNCQVWKNMTLPLVQIPLWVTLSLTIRSLLGWDSFLISSTPDKLEPSLLSEGGLWFQDLSQADPYGALPIILGVVSLTNVEFLSKYNPVAINSRFVKDNFSNRLTIFDSILNISRLSVVFLMGISSQAPSILALYWISSNLYSLMQNVAFQYFMPLGNDYYSDNSVYLKKGISKDPNPVPYIVAKDALPPVTRASEKSVNRLLELEK